MDATTGNRRGQLPLSEIRRMTDVSRWQLTAALLLAQHAY
jgi:hypothetical protein